MKDNYYLRVDYFSFFSKIKTIKLFNTIQLFYYHTIILIFNNFVAFETLNKLKFYVFFSVNMDLMGKGRTEIVVMC